MRPEIFFGRVVEMAGGDDDIRVHIVAVLENFAHHITSRGELMRPVTALAAATYGEAR